MENLIFITFCFIISMSSVFSVLLSVNKMKDMLNYKNRSKMLRLITGPHDDMLLIIKFFKSYSKFRESGQKNKYLMICFHCCPVKKFNRVRF